jgi:hypothetical protein
MLIQKGAVPKNLSFSLIKYALSTVIRILMESREKKKHSDAGSGK